MSKNLKAGAGDEMRDILREMCKNRVLGLFTGFVVTAVLSSSSASSVMLVSFVESGYITFEQSIGALLGVNIGTTVPVLLVSFKLTRYSLAFISLGYAIKSISIKGSRRAYLGEALLGLGLLFFGIDIMGDAMKPLRSYEPFLNMLKRMDDTFTAVVASTLFTLAIQSSAAVLSIVMLLGGQGFLSQKAGVAMVLGANIGTTGTALVASLGKKVGAVQVGFAYLLLKAIGVLLTAPLIDIFIELVYRVQLKDPVYPESKEERMAAVPDIVSAAHVVFNVVLALALLPFTDLIGAFVRTLIPDCVTTEPAKAE
eukprot:CAMPEP_0170186590 /NCGR_PEP_ID=MMETSP0040_2-20121228/39618_1 /TAXON_ID=641309 /ORGANISM="Lotharella oceanica, Strain CCMP622" /LENGTH=311 /DNA_ID=CAMNT_0010433391 /DNA_START=42 /DNA_END=977 /DNA_ORIENTATION=-